MKIVHKADANKNVVTNSCIAYEYPLNDKDINAVVIEINGRYPHKGRTVNEVCKELAYVIDGSGRVVIEDQEFEIAEGTSILINPGEKFYWEGNLKMFMPCTPAWYPQQHKEVE